MKNFIVLSAILAAIMTAGDASAQCFARRGLFARRSCAAYYQTSSNRYAYAAYYGAYGVAPQCSPCAVVQSTPSACEPVAKSEEYIPTCDEAARTTCEDGFCMIRERVGATSKGDSVAEVYLREINATRARYGLAPLTLDASLTAGAAAHSQRQAQRGAIFHAAGCGAEVVAQNWSSGIIEAIGQWLNSPAHCALLLSSGFSRCGVATVRTSDGRNFCTLRFN